MSNKMAFQDKIVDGVWPVRATDVSFLLGLVLTHIDAWSEPKETSKARKDLVSQTIWRWFVDIEMSRQSLDGEIKLKSK